MGGPAVLYCPEACEADMVQTAIRNADNETDCVKNLYKSARFIRQRIEDFTKTEKPSSTAITSIVEDVPLELESLIRWIMVGPAEKLSSVVQQRITL